MQTATVPNLAATDHAFTLDTGETAVVSVQVQPFKPEDTVVNVAVAGRLVDPATGAVLMVGQSAVQAAPHNYGVHSGALADGADLTAIVADGMQEQAQRARRFKAALESLNRLGASPA